MVDMSVWQSDATIMVEVSAARARTTHTKKRHIGRRPWSSARELCMVVSAGAATMVAVGHVLEKSAVRHHPHEY